jgi:hypothetical protein
MGEWRWEERDGGGSVMRDHDRQIWNQIEYLLLE